jgi:hypothetical protein
MSQKSSLAQSAHSVRRALTAYKLEYCFLSRRPMNVDFDPSDARPPYPFRYALVDGRPVNELRAGMTFGFPLILSQPATTKRRLAVPVVTSRLPSHIGRPRHPCLRMAASSQKICSGTAIEKRELA